MRNLQLLYLKEPITNFNDLNYFPLPSPVLLQTADLDQPRYVADKECEGQKEWQLSTVTPIHTDE